MGDSVHTGWRLTHLDKLQCGCWGWSPAGRAEAGRDTSHRGGPRPVQWWHSTESLCRQCLSAALGTSGCWPEWNMGLSCNLECERRQKDRFYDHTPILHQDLQIHKTETLLMKTLHNKRPMCLILKILNFSILRSALQEFNVFYPRHCK